MAITPGNGKRLLSQGWPLNRGSSEIGMKPFRKVTSFQCKIVWKGITASHEENKLVFG